MEVGLSETPKEFEVGDSIMLRTLFNNVLFGEIFTVREVLGDYYELCDGSQLLKGFESFWRIATKLEVKNKCKIDA